MSSTNSTSIALPVVAFYAGGEDDEGRTLDEIQHWSEGNLEYNHDYIQWLFPLPERSPFNPYAPKFDNATQVVFQTKPELQARLRDSLSVMLTFYGFKSNLVHSKDLPEDLSHTHNIRITRDAERFPRQARNWFNSHNDLRITRIIRCLRYAGLDAEAAAFYNALKEIYESKIAHPRPVGKNSFMYWTRAAKRDLRIPPDWNDERAEHFLRETAETTSDAQEL